MSTYSLNLQWSSENLTILTLIWLCVTTPISCYYIVAPALDAVDVAEIQVECTHKILLAIPALSNGVLSHLAKVDEHMHWLVWSKHRQEQSHLFLISSQLLAVWKDFVLYSCAHSYSICCGQSFEFTANRSVPRPSMSAAANMVMLYVDLCYCRYTPGLAEQTRLAGQAKSPVLWFRGGGQKKK